MNKVNFLTELLGGIGSKISSRRTLMIWCMLLFSFLLILNTFTGGEKGLKPSDTFQTQLFEVLITSLVLVFGDIVIKVLGFLRGKKVDLPDLPADETAKQEPLPDSGK